MSQFRDVPKREVPVIPPHTQPDKTCKTFHAAVKSWRETGKLTCLYCGTVQDVSGGLK